MKKAEAISILATSVRPREAKDRARYDEAVRMAIEALKCSETPNSSDCISRQAAIDYCYALINAENPSNSGDYWNYSQERINQTETILHHLEFMPSAQPERKKGRWLRYGEDGYPNNEDTVFWQCDQCLEQYTGRTKRIPNFCPNCGADMRGGDSNE